MSIVAWSYLKTQLDFLNHLVNSNKMENVPMSYQNRKLLYFSHNQFLYYRLLGKEKEPKKKKEKKLWHMFHKTNYHIL